MTHKYRNVVLSAIFLSIALILPFFTGQIKQVGNSLCPMHIPVLICGFICGPGYALAVGITAPILRFFLFGMPPIIPNGIAMCFELGSYGLSAGVLFRLLPKKKSSIYVSLICSMIIGRCVWGVFKTILSCFSKYKFGYKMFISSAFLNSIPGIIVQIILIPVLVMAIAKYNEK